VKECDRYYHCAFSKEPSLHKNLRFTTRRAFGIREREVFVFVRMGKFERMMAEFAKELLVTVFVVTVFV
jgi:hypothetical protein